MRLPRMLVVGNQPYRHVNVSTRHGQPLRRLPYPGGSPTGCSFWSGCLVWLAALPVAALTYVTVGFLAPESKSLLGVSQAQLGAVLTIVIIIFFMGFIVASVRGQRAVLRLPCPQCGDRPLEVAHGYPLLFVCNRCVVAWEVYYRFPTSDGAHHHHS